MQAAHERGWAVSNLENFVFRPTVTCNPYLKSWLQKPVMVDKDNIYSTTTMTTSVIMRLVILLI